MDYGLIVLIGALVVATLVAVYFFGEEAGSDSGFDRGIESANRSWEGDVIKKGLAEYRLVANREGVSSKLFFFIDDCDCDCDEE